MPLFIFRLQQILPRIVLCVLVAYAAPGIMRLSSKPQRYGKIVDKDGNGLQFAVVRVHQASTGVEVRHTVTDGLGRYFCLVPNGDYYVKVERRTEPESFAPAFTSDIVRIEKGVIDKEFKM